MWVEAELKALVRAPDELARRLRRLAEERAETYHDTYFDRPDQALLTAGQQLRVREIESESGTRRVLTFKDTAVPGAGGSMREIETGVDDAATMREILGHLGYRELATLTKHCRNYRFEHGARPMLATLVTVPDVEDTFIEVETLTEPPEVEAALTTVRAVLTDLGIDEADHTVETYTEARARAGSPTPITAPGAPRGAADT